MVTDFVTPIADVLDFATGSRYPKTGIIAGVFRRGIRLLQSEASIAARTLYLDAFKDHGKLHRADRPLPVTAMEAPPFQALVPDGKAACVPPQGLHLVPAPIEEHEHLPGSRILAEMRAAHPRQAVEGLAHVGTLAAHEYPKIRGAQHERACVEGDSSSHSISSSTKPGDGADAIRARRP